MAGTLFGLPLSQRVDSNGLPSVGWLLYVYAANTSTPVNSFQDTGLSVLNPWPIQADASGMMREFWLADGSYRARATSADGSLTYFDRPNILALGPSSTTGGPPPPGVDPNAIFQTGDTIWSDASGTRAGWVRDNGRTIGSATSGATERPNADCQPLFEWLWNHFSNTVCPVVGGRGPSSGSDWAASKQITLPDKRGFTVIGADDMGNTAAGRFTGVPIINGAVTTPGSTVGENTHVTTQAEMPAHTHTATVTDPGHVHTLTNGSNILQFSAGVGPEGINPGVNAPVVNISVNSATTGVTVANASVGGGTGHNTVANSVIMTVYRKL